MTPFDAYTKYVALKLHFKDPSYDYFKFNGHVKVSKQTFESRKDYYYFQKISKIYKEKDFEDLLLANLIKTPDMWIGNILSDDGKRTYYEWKKIHQSVEYSFTQDLLKLQSLIDSGEFKSFDSFFVFNKHHANWPPLVDFVLRKEITIETFIIMNKILNFIVKFDSNIEDEHVWPELRRVCVKYTPFLGVSIPRYKEIMKQTFLEKK